jgi:hypothetical protein
MLRSEDRLGEAEFFLDKLRQTKGNGREFRYYLSALASAARSISLVLQSDLRSKQKYKFDEWWSKKKTEIPPQPFRFELIRDLRNKLQKQGSKVPVVMKTEDSRSGITIESVVDVFDANAWSLLSITLRDMPPLYRELTETDDEFEAKFWKQVEEFAFPQVVGIAKRLHELDRPQTTGFVFPDGETYDFEAIVFGFRDYLRSMRKLIEEANDVFPDGFDEDDPDSG